MKNEVYVELHHCFDSTYPEIDISLRKHEEILFMEIKKYKTMQRITRSRIVCTIYST